MKNESIAEILFKLGKNETTVADASNKILEIIGKIKLECYNQGVRDAKGIVSKKIQFN